MLSTNKRFPCNWGGGVWFWIDFLDSLLSGLPIGSLVFDGEFLGRKFKKQETPLGCFLDRLDRYKLTSLKLHAIQVSDLDKFCLRRIASLSKFNKEPKICIRSLKSVVRAPPLSTIHQYFGKVTSSIFLGKNLLNFGKRCSKVEGRTRRQTGSLALTQDPKGRGHYRIARGEPVVAPDGLKTEDHPLVVIVQSEDDAEQWIIWHLQTKFVEGLDEGTKMKGVEASQGAVDTAKLAPVAGHKIGNLSTLGSNPAVHHFANKSPFPNTCAPHVPTLSSHSQAILSLPSRKPLREPCKPCKPCQPAT
ncbi:hypothetical protein VNO77_15475 [Canavalia gladiata]|uniref:Uncharacterized protein n=1 Tax=Canavalia gladiata TaxID=3824 RepID=A0AAN9M417_CANGL